MSALSHCSIKSKYYEVYGNWKQFPFYILIQCVKIAVTKKLIGADMMDNERFQNQVISTLGQIIDKLEKMDNRSIKVEDKLAKHDEKLDTIIIQTDLTKEQTAVNTVTNVHLDRRITRLEKML